MRLHSHVWDYDKDTTYRRCHKCGAEEWCHMIRHAPSGWAGHNEATVTWRKYRETFVTPPKEADDGTR